MKYHLNTTGTLIEQFSLFQFFAASAVRNFLDWVQVIFSQCLRKFIMSNIVLTVSKEVHNMQNLQIVAFFPSEITNCRITNLVLEGSHLAIRPICRNPKFPKSAITKIVCEALLYLRLCVKLCDNLL